VELGTAPGCFGAVLQETTGSGNTFGSKLWTDGKLEAPMLPDRPEWVKCPHCAHLFWVEEARKLGEWNIGKRNSLRADWPKAQTPLVPSESDYYAALKTPPQDPKKERYLRVRALLVRNDHFRQVREIPEEGTASSGAGR